MSTWTKDIVSYTPMIHVFLSINYDFQEGKQLIALWLKVNLSCYFTVNTADMWNGLNNAFEAIRNS